VRRISCTQRRHQERNKFKEEMATYEQFIPNDSATSSIQLLDSSLADAVIARTTKLEYMLVKASMKTKNAELKTCVTGQLVKFAAETKQWDKSTDAMDVMWRPLWDYIKGLIT
jgi:hypothetical protein